MHSSCMHENACKCANLLACGMHAACMPACMIHACSAGMHSLEGFAYLCLFYKTDEISSILNCFCAIGWSNVSKNEYTCSVGPSQPEMMGLPTGLGLWIFVSLHNIGILGGLGVVKAIS